MTIALAQETYSGASAGATTITATLTCTSGNALHVIGGVNDTTHTLSLADGTNTYTKRGSEVVLGSIRLAQWTAVNITGGALTFTLTNSFSSSNRFIIVREISGAALAAFDIANSASQATPGTSTDGVTVSATNSVQPAFISAYALRCFFNTTMTAGTGFTAGGGQSTGGAGEGAWASEHKRVTSATSQAATFTVGNNGNVISVQAIFDELVAAATKGRLANSNQGGF